MTKEKPLSEKVILIKEKEIGTKKFISRVNLTKDVAEAVERLKGQIGLKDDVAYIEINKLNKVINEIFGELKQEGGEDD